jgi:hypothetical protein
MASMQANPWSFTSADQANTTTITSIVRNNQGSATITVGSTTNFPANTFISVQGVTGSGLGPWNRVYPVLAVAGSTLLVPLFDTQRLLANVGAVGNIYTCIYPSIIEVTQMLWDGATTGSLSITDGSGNVVWAPSSPAFSGTLQYMKAFPIFGLVLNTLGSGTLQISV